MGNPLDELRSGAAAAAGNPLDALRAGSIGGVTPPTSYTPLGFLKNFGGGLVRMAQGLTAIGGAVIGDAARLVQEAVTLGEAETSGYATAAIAKALPSAIAGDYSHRYGGVTNIAKGLYEDPFAYLSDIFLFAGGAGAAAKVGRVGLMSKLPRILPESTALKILGTEGAATGYAKGTQLAASLERGVGGTEAFSLSYNPAVRTIQQGLQRAGSVAPGRVFRGLADADMIRMEHATNTALANGIRILRPSISRVMSKGTTGRALSALRVTSRDTNMAITAKYKTLLAEAEKLDNTVDPELVTSFLEGTTIPMPSTIPTNEIIDLKHTLPILDTDNIPDPVAALPESNVAIQTKLIDEFGAKAQLDRYPHLGPDVRAASPRSTIEVLSIDEAPAIVERAAAALDGELLGVIDTLANDTEMAQFVGVIRTADGSIAHVNVAPRNLLRSQIAGDDVVGKMGVLRAEVTRLQKELTDVSNATNRGGEITFLAAQLDDALDNLYGASETAKALFDGPRRTWWSDHGPTQLDPNLRAADTLRPEVYLDITKPWLEEYGGSFSTLMNSRYRSQRVGLFYQSMADTKIKLTALFREVVDPQERALAVAELLRNDMIPDSIIQEIMGKFPRNLDAEGAAQLVAQRMRKNLWDHTVVEGGNGLRTGFPEYDWREMHRARVESGIPIPEYFPQFKKKSSEYMFTRAGKSMTPGSPPPTKRWQGLLAETGRYERDPVVAYGRAAAAFNNHQESIALADRLFKAFGRKLSRRQQVAWAGEAHPNEVLVVPAQVRKDLNLRGEMLSDTIAGMGEHGDIVRATRDSMSILSERAFIEGANNLANAEVWAMPRHVMKQFDTDLALNLRGGIVSHYDSAMQMWKQAVLSLTPRWLINNFFGNQFFMGIENPAAIRYGLTQLNHKNEALLRAVLGPDIMNNIETGFFRTTMKNEWSHIDPVEEPALLARAEEVIKSAPPSRALSWFSGKSFHMNSVQEQAARRGVFISAVAKANLDGFVPGFHSTEGILKKLFQNGIDEAGFRKGITAVNKTLGDYETYSVFEQAIVRRFMMPFYGFYRHSARVLVRMPYEHPVKAAVLQQLAKLDDQMNEDMPEFLRGSMLLGEYGGKDLLLRLRQLNPLSGVSQDLPLISSLNPVAKVALERTLGVDTLTGEPFEDPNIVNSGGINWRIIRDGEGNFAGLERADGIIAPPLIAHLAGQLPQLQLIPQFERYPKAFWLQISSYLGASLTATDLQGNLEYEQESMERAESMAENRIEAEQGSSNPLDALRSISG